MKFIKRVGQKLNIDIEFKQLLSSSFYSLLIRIAGMSSSYVILFVISRNYGPAVLGNYNLFYSVIMIASLVAGLGLDRAIVRFIAIYKNEENTLKTILGKSYILVGIGGLILAVIVYFASGLLDHWLSDSGLLTVYLTVGCICIFLRALISLNGGILRANNQIAKFSLLNENLTRILFLIILLLGFFGSFLQTSETMILGYVIACALVTSISGIWVYKFVNRISFQFPSRSILKTSIPIMTSSTFGTLSRWIDILILGVLVTDFEVGIYSACVRVSMLSNIMLNSVNSMAGSKIAHYYHDGDITKLNKVVKKSTKMIFWSSLPPLLLLIFGGKFILGFLDSEFQIGFLALLLLSLGQFFAASSGSVGLILQMTSSEKLHQNIVIFCFGLNLVLNLITIPSFGINGAAFSAMTSLIVNNSICIYFVYKKIGIITLYLPPFTR